VPAASVERSGDRSFCCSGCRIVYELLTASGLGQYYDLAPAAGSRMTTAPADGLYRYLDDPAVRERLVDYSDARTTRVTFRIPVIHCIACVWLLENLFRLKPGLGRSRVNFPRKEVSVAFDPGQVALSEVAALLASLGYEPELKLSALDKPSHDRARRRLHLQIGLAGFAFGNIMLFSISSYLGLDSVNGPGFRRLMGYLSLALATPVFLYSAADYWRTAFLSFRRRFVTIDVPIALGLVAIFAQSLFEVLSGRGEGYFDSLTGLIFFLLCGRLFQHITYDRLAFDRDYRSFFPLSVVRLAPGGEERIALSRLEVGDRLALRHGDLIPADATLLSGTALVDYSFVTGESDPAAKSAGDHLYAGGRQIGGRIEIQTVKAVSQSYLTSLWNQEAFRKEKRDSLDTLTNRYSKRFTGVIMAVAVGAAVFWFPTDPGRALKAFTSVLIVACPCALALAAPFTLGTVQRWLARGGCFLKNGNLLESLATVDSVVFDKTGTLTLSSAGSVRLEGGVLSEAETQAVVSLARQSNHPNAVRIGRLSDRGADGTAPVESFVEVPGCGIEGRVNGLQVRLGSASWLQARGVSVAPALAPMAGCVHIAIEGAHRGCYRLTSVLRPQVAGMIERIKARCRVTLLSGDQPRERARFEALFGDGVPLHFNQGPGDKLAFVRGLQSEGRTVMMVGDGLNDAGALQQSDVGVAVVEEVGAFSPASDVILDGRGVVQLSNLLDYSRAAVRIVRLSFLLSTLYNIVGISIAARGLLAPITCAILMPLSSASVVAFACGLATWSARRTGWRERRSSESESVPVRVAPALFRTPGAEVAP
jgi:Cu+-exporting ATPase